MIREVKSSDLFSNGRDEYRLPDSGADNTVGPIAFYHGESTRFQDHRDARAVPRELVLASTVVTRGRVERASGLLRLTPKSGQVVVWSGGLEGRLVGLSGQVVFVL